MVTAKQRAWRAKFAKMAKSGEFRKGKRKIVTKTIYKTRRVYPTMARRRRYSRSIRRIGGGGKGILNKVLIGLGASSLGGLVAARVGVNPMLVSGAAGYIAGGPVGAISAIAIPMLSNSVLGQANTGSSGTIWA